MGRWVRGWDEEMEAGRVGIVDRLRHKVWQDGEIGERKIDEKRIGIHVG